MNLASSRQRKENSLFLTPILIFRMLLITNSMGVGGNEVFPGEGWLTRLEFVITCLNFTYSVLICAILFIIKILVMDMSSNRINYSTGTRLFIMFNRFSQLSLITTHALMAHRGWPSMQENLPRMIACYLVSQEMSVTIYFFSNVSTDALESRDKTRMLT